MIGTLKNRTAWVAQKHKLFGVISVLGFLFLFVQSHHAFQNPPNYSSYQQPWTRQPQGVLPPTFYDSAQEEAKTGSAPTQSVTGQMYSNPPELTPEQMQARQRATERMANLIGPLPAGSLTTATPRPIDPASSAPGQAIRPAVGVRRSSARNPRTSLRPIETSVRSPLITMILATPAFSSTFSERLTFSFRTRLLSPLCKSGASIRKR